MLQESWDSFNLDPKTVAAKVTRFADANTTVRKVNKFGMTAYCLLHSQINDDRVCIHENQGPNLLLYYVKRIYVVLNKWPLNLKLI